MTSKPYSVNFIVAEAAPAGVIPSNGFSFMSKRRVALRRLAGRSVELTMDIVPHGSLPVLFVTGLSGKTIAQRRLVPSGKHCRSGALVLPRGAYLISIHEGMKRVYEQKIVID